jgi:predicted site-specific integrase-resolvase
VGNSLPDGGNVAILPQVEVLRILKISKPTMKKWIENGDIKPRVWKFAGRVHRGYKDTEIEALAARIKKQREPGKSLLK